MKDREREWKRSIERDERQLRDMDRVIEQIESDGVESPGRLTVGQKIVHILFGYILPLVLVAGFFVGVAKLWKWLIG